MARHKVILKRVSLQSDLKGIVLAVSSILRVPAREAVDQVKHLPLTILSDCAPEQARKVARLFSDMGAEVSIEPPLMEVAIPGEKVATGGGRFHGGAWRLVLMIALVLFVSVLALYWGGDWITGYARSRTERKPDPEIRTMMKNAQGQIETAKANLEKRLQENPRDVDLLVQKAVVYLGLARKKMESQGWSPYGKTDGVPESGMDLLPVPEADSALRVLYRARELDANNSEVYRWLAEVYIQKGLAEDALAFARKALDLNPQNPVYWNLLGLCYQETEQIGQAEMALRKALSLDTNHLETWRNLAVLLLYHQKDTLQGMEFLRRYLEREGGKDLDRYFLRRELMAIAWAQYNEIPEWNDSKTFGEYEQERSVLQKRIASDGKNARWREQLGLLYAGRGMWAEAVAELQIAVRLDPRSQSAWKVLIALLALRGEWDALGAAAQKAAQLPDADVFFLKNCALIQDYYRLDPRRAREYYQHYYRRGGDPFLGKLLRQRGELMR